MRPHCDAVGHLRRLRFAHEENATPTIVVSPFGCNRGMRIVGPDDVFAPSLDEGPGAYMAPTEEGDGVAGTHPTVVNENDRHWRDPNVWLGGTESRRDEGAGPVRSRPFEEDFVLPIT